MASDVQYRAITMDPARLPRYAERAGLACARLSGAPPTAGRVMMRQSATLRADKNAGGNDGSDRWRWQIHLQGQRGLGQTANDRIHRFPSHFYRRATLHSAA